MGRPGTPRSPAQPAERDAARAAKLEALHTTLTEQVAALRNGRDWQRWLTVAARLPQYSANNVLLIAAQRPDATAVAGYGAWKALGRQVNKGEKGIAILAPILTKAARTAADTDSGAGTGVSSDIVAGSGEVGSGQQPAGNPRHPGEVGPGQVAAAPRAVGGFTVAYVFDVSQTSGPPLPEQPAPALLTGQAPPGLWDTLTTQLTAHGFTLRRADCAPGVNGLTHYGQRTVTVRPDVDDAQAVKTLAHELAHVLLHDPATLGRPPAAPPAAAGPVLSGPAAPTSLHCRGRIEVEAESVAYLVAATCGLDTGSYSFPYVAGWASSVPGRSAAPDTVVRATAERVLTAARQVLTGIDAATTSGAGSTARAVDLARVQVGAERGADRTDRLLRTVAATEQAAAHLAQRSTARADAADALAAGVAEHAGRTRPRPVADVAAPSPDRLIQIHEIAVAFYRTRLTGPDGERARDLLTARGVGPAAAARAELGYAPRTWTRLVEHLRIGGVDDRELLASGLATTTRRGRLVDRFRDRIIFPVQTASGRTVGLLGRTVDPAATGRTSAVPKYLNSPDTTVYAKGEVLYGLAHARAALTAGAVPVLVEGPLDALAVNQAGGGFAGVAPCGTALTTAQVEQLEHATGGLAQRGLIVAFDGDDAGRHASVRAFHLLRAAGAWPHTLELPPEQDPAGLLQQHGPARLRAALAAAADRPLADLVVDERINRHADRMHWAEGRVAAGRDAAAVVVATFPPQEVARQVVRLAVRLDLPAAEIGDLLVDAVTTHDPAPRRPSTSPRADVAPTAAQRARAAFPQPLTVDLPARPATPAGPLPAPTLGRTVDVPLHAARPA